MIFFNIALTVTDLRFYAGQELTVSGKVKSGCDYFSINIGHDVNNIALHFNPRFKYNKDRNVIVCNSNRGGWGSEQKEKVFPFQRDGDFRVIVYCTKYSLSGRDSFSRGLWIIFSFTGFLFDFIHVRNDYILYVFFSDFF
uniref:Galectin n=1 Tax=Astyanax mexicanus TaxID=7994 RepID=A0A8B9HVF5_ASTMX